jgi:hypothetical protein
MAEDPTPTPTPMEFPPTPTPVPPWKHTFDVILNETEFTAGEVMELKVRVAPCLECDEFYTDAYIAVLTPGGRMFFLKSNFQLTVYPTPFITDFPITKERTVHIASFLLENLPQGDYRWLGVCTVPEGQVFDPSMWSSNLDREWWSFDSPSGNGVRITIWR